MAQAENKGGDSGSINRWCWVVVLLIIIASAVIRGRLVSMPLERDEGEYAYIGQQMLQGVPPYISAYSLKLPGIFVVYAIILEIFGQSASAVHQGLIVFNAATILVIFLLSKKLFGAIGGITAAGTFACMSLSRSVLGLSANAEQFVLLPALVGIFLILFETDRYRYLRLLIAGLLLGLAFTIKQHGIFFILYAVVYLFYTEIRRRPLQWKKTIIKELILASGAAMPFLAICTWLWRAGAFEKFWFWTFRYASKYVNEVPLYAAPILFWMQFVEIIQTSAPFLILALMGIFGVLFSKSLRGRTVFVLGFIIFSFLCTCPGFYFRSHYFIFVLPAISMLVGAAFTGLAGSLKSSGMRRFILIAIIGLGSIGYTLFNQREFLFLNEPIRVCRLVYGANPFVESPVIAEYIRANTKPDDTIAIIGSEPQICFYSGRRSATGYIYTYPLMESNVFAAEMQKEMALEIEKAKPKIIVYINISSSWMVKKNSIKDIFHWCNMYMNKYYEAAGVVEILPSWETVYLWDEAAKHYSVKDNDWVVVLRRKG